MPESGVSRKYLNCAGNTVYEKGSRSGSELVPPPPDPWFEDKELVDNLFYIIAKQ
jgi:hypothetical protein